jgi:hypothetical protein
MKHPAAEENRSWRDADAGPRRKASAADVTVPFAPFGAHLAALH